MIIFIYVFVRVLYLLQQGSTEENVTFLLNFVFEVW